MKTPSLLLIGLLLALLLPVSPVQAQSGDDLLRDAAFYDGLHKIMQQVRRLNLTSSTKVMDFVISDPRLELQLSNACRDKITFEHVRFHDGSREARLSLTLADLIVQLKTCVRLNPGLARAWPEARFDLLKKFHGTLTLKAVGGAHHMEAARAILGRMAGVHMGRWPDVMEMGLAKARQAAREKAMANLYKRIEGLTVAERHLRDFIPPGGKARKFLKEYVRQHARDVDSSSPRYLEDLTCEMDIEIKMDALIARLGQLALSGVDPDFTRRFAGLARSTLPIAGGRSLLRATGVGYPLDEYLPQDLRSPSRRPNWARAVLKATGIGTPPASVESEEEARGQGYQLAKKDAEAKLMGDLKGHALRSGKTLQALLNPHRIAKLKDLIREASVRDLGFVDKQYQVEIELNLWKVWNLVRKW